MIRRLALFAAVVLVLAAPAAAADADHVVRPYGLHLALPSSWPSLSAADAGKPAAVAALTRVDPAYAALAKAMRAPGYPTRFVALDTTRSDGFATNVTLLVRPVRRGTSLDEYRRSLVAEVRTARVTGLRTVRVDLPLGPAIRMSYRLHPNAAPPLGRTVSTLQYAFMHGRLSFVVTFATLPALDARYGPIFARAARSLRFS